MAPPMPLPAPPDASRDQPQQITAAPTGRTAQTQAMPPSQPTAHHGDLGQRGLVSTGAANVGVTSCTQLVQPLYFAYAPAGPAGQRDRRAIRRPVCALGRKSSRSARTDQVQMCRSDGVQTSGRLMAVRGNNFRCARAAHRCCRRTQQVAVLRGEPAWRGCARPSGTTRTRGRHRSASPIPPYAAAPSAGRPAARAPPRSTSFSAGAHDPASRTDVRMTPAPQGSEGDADHLRDVCPGSSIGPAGIRPVIQCIQ